MLQQPILQEETPCTRTQEVSWETLLNKGRKLNQILCYNLQENDLNHQEGPSTQEGALNPRTLVPKRGAHLLPSRCICCNFQTHKKDMIPQWGNIPYLY
jgi:hypothetical protein